MYLLIHILPFRSTNPKHVIPSLSLKDLTMLMWKANAENIVKLTKKIKVMTKTTTID